MLGEGAGGQKAPRPLEPGAAGTIGRMRAQFHTRRRFLAAAAVIWPPAGGRAAGPLTVGPGKRFSRLADAVAEARDGDTVLVDEGDYRGDVGAIERRGLVLRGLGRGAVFHADGRHAEGKAIWVVRGEVTMHNLEFRGARVPSGNGAGIRFERGHLALRGCRFFDNENGLLSANEGGMTLDIESCEFGQAPRHMGLLHHLLYVGTIGRLRLRHSRFSQGWRGHLVKSRAAENVVFDNLLADGELGEASYELEFPNGGRNVVVGNVIAQSALTQNPTLLSMGAEGRPADGGTLLLAHNTFVDGGARDARFLHLWAERLGAGLSWQAFNNVFAGPGRLELPDAVDGGGNVRVPADALDAGFRPRRPLPARAVALPPEAGPRRALPGAAGAAGALR